MPEPMAKPDLAGLPPWAGWSGAGKLKLRLATYSRCRDCKDDIHAIAEYFMVLDPVWKQAGLCKQGGFLCIGCLETRIGRRLVSADFTDAPVNRAEVWGPPGYEKLPIRRSARFADRLAR